MSPSSFSSQIHHHSSYSLLQAQSRFVYSSDKIVFLHLDIGLYLNWLIFPNLIAKYLPAKHMHRCASGYSYSTVRYFASVMQTVHLGQLDRVCVVDGNGTNGIHKLKRECPGVWMTDSRETRKNACASHVRYERHCSVPAQLARATCGGPGLLTRYVCGIRNACSFKAWLCKNSKVTCHQQVGVKHDDRQCGFFFVTCLSMCRGSTTFYYEWLLGWLPAWHCVLPSVGVQYLAPFCDRYSRARVTCRRMKTKAMVERDHREHGPCDCEIRCVHDMSRGSST